MATSQLTVLQDTLQHFVRFPIQLFSHFQCIVNAGGGSTAVLVEELTDISTNIWDADCDFSEGFNAEPQQQLTNNANFSSNDSGTYVCTVCAEVHSDPLQDIDSSETASLEHGERATNYICTDDEDVSTQVLDVSSSNVTSPSCYSARSTSVPSLISQNTTTIRSSDTLTSSTLDVSKSGDLAQEIVDLVQSEDFVTDTVNTVLHNSSSQLFQFNGHDTRGTHTDTDLSISTPTRVEGGTGISATRPEYGAAINTGASESTEREQMIIPLRELDGRLGGAIMFEDWDQELQSTL